MSSFEDDCIWVGDLDGYISISAISEDYAREKEEEKLQAELDNIGEIFLLNSKAISSHLLYERGIGPYEWDWAIRQAEKRLRPPLSNQELEQTLLRAFLSLGRPYAIARYASWEKVPYLSAQTASLPLGLRALLFQYLSGQNCHLPHQHSSLIRSVLEKATKTPDVTAYNRTSMVQSLIHHIAQETKGRGGVDYLDREATRIMLSLTRLYFSVLEIKFDTFADMSELCARYAGRREAEKHSSSPSPPTKQIYIRNWRMRHLRPLTDFFPFAIRYGLERGIRHVELNKALTKEIAVNELALAQCAIFLMRGKRKNRLEIC